jgi:hypothetical protein
MNIKKFITSRLVINASPHFYFGDSIFWHLIHIASKKILYLRTKKPSKKAFTVLSEMRDSKVGKVALVLGNGKSLDTLNVREVPNFVDDIFVVNDFFKTEISMKIKPNFYCLSDPASFTDAEFDAMNPLSSFSSYLSDLSITLLLPHNINFLGSQKTLKFNDLESPFYLSKSINPTKPRGYTSVTLYKALAIACHLNYDKIFILGLDNTEFQGYSSNYVNHVLAKPNYAGFRLEFRQDLESRYMDVLVSGIAGRMTSYGRLFSDLRKFPVNKIENLDEYSLTDAFPKVRNHPLIKSEPA